MAPLSDLDGGPVLAAELAACDPQSLSPADAVACLQATERMIAWAQARQDDALVAVAGARPRAEVHDVSSGAITIEDAARSEVAAALRWADPWAHERITAARLLRGPLHRTGAALREGGISRRHADIVCTAAQRLASFSAWLRHSADPDEMRFFAQCDALERATLPLASARGVSATRRCAERALLRIDAAHADRRRAQRRRDRDVWVQDDGDGLALLMARMGVAEAHACLGVIDAQARSRVDGTRADGHPPLLVGEHRAEALARLVLTPSAGRAPANPGDDERGPETPTAAGPQSPTGPVRTHVEIVVSLDALLGLVDDSGSLTGSGPGGPVPVSLGIVRDLIAADETSTMRRLVTDPITGHLLDRGRSTYAVPRALREYLVARDRTCRFPGCGRRAHAGQADHALPWDSGGATTRANLGMLCVRHHQLKTHGGWTLERSAVDGSCSWLSPAGVRHDLPPPRLLSVA